MSRITIPASIEEATSKLEGLDALLTSKEWEKAALVYAFTYEAGQGSRTSRNTAKLSFTKFAKLGIAGLRNHETVAAYHQAWIDANGALDIGPGDRVELPDIPWPGRQDDAGKKRYVEKTEQAVGKSIDRGDLDADVLAQNLSDEAAEAVMSRLIEDRPDLAVKAGATIMADPDTVEKVLADPKAQKGTAEGGRRVVQKRVREKFPKPAAAPVTSSAGTSPNNGGLAGMVDLLTVEEALTRISIAFKNVGDLMPNVSEETRQHVISWMDNVLPELADQLREQTIGLANISPEDFG